MSCPSSEAVPTKARVLIVEDEVLVAMEMEGLLASVGCTVVGPASTVSGAAKLLSSAPVDAVLLDLNLNGENATAFATELASRSIPCIVVTGYGAKLAGSPGLESAFVLEKPVDYELLLTALEEVLSPERGTTERQ